jgi:hypothetical protein
VKRWLIGLLKLAGAAVLLGVMAAAGLAAGTLLSILLVGGGL